MSEQHIPNFSKIVKNFAHTFSYNPSPRMEEKIVKVIRRQKIKRISYKVGAFALILLIVIFFSSEKIGLESKNMFSLNWFLKDNNQLRQNSVQANENNFDYLNGFDLVIGSDAINDNDSMGNASDSDIKSNNGTTVSKSEKEEDNLFKMLKYVSIANDGEW